MNDTKKSTAPTGENWHFAKHAQELRAKKVMMVRVAGKQIALFDTADGIRACDNRCPHEGYPLSEGTVSDGCTLTCNWHNWKFNLDNGENLYGGDRLHTYPVALRADEIWVELSDPPYAEHHAAIVKSLRDAFDDHEYDRIAREIARLIALGCDPLDVLRLSIEWSWQRMEFGWTHAYAGMADWLLVYEQTADDAELQLVCLLESVGHIAFDVLRESEYPYSDTILPYDEGGFLRAVENEDPETALSMVRGGLRDGLKFSDLERALTHAALAHYNDFGHSLIYVTKAAYLIDTLGEVVTEPLLLSLVRGFIFASREDKIPEFRAYQSTLAQWHSAENTEHSNDPPDASLWRKTGINKALALTLSNRHVDSMHVYHALLEANALNMLSFDLTQQQKTHVSVSGNVNWLSFTHGLTFANAVRKQCAIYPEFWPQALLQMACFIGRNAAFTTTDYDVHTWCENDPESELNELLQRCYDHGQDDYIVSVHWLKTALAVREEIATLSDAQSKVLVAALKRYIESPLKRKQTRRTAYQSLKFVS